jgi:hypothetical protein
MRTQAEDPVRGQVQAMERLAQAGKGRARTTRRVYFIYQKMKNLWSMDNGNSANRLWKIHL